MKIKLIWTDSIYFFLTNLFQIASLCLPWLVAGAAIELLIITTSPDPAGQPTILWALAFSFNLVVRPIYSGCLILLMANQAKNMNMANQELLAGAMKVWRPFFLLYILAGTLIAFVGITALSIVTQITSLLLGTQASPILGLFIILPLFLWGLARISFAKFKLVLDSLNPVEALQKSFEATRPHVRLIISVVLPFAAPVIAATYLLIGLPPENAAGHTLRALIGISASFLMLFVDVLIFRIYMGASRNSTTDAL